MSDKVEVNGGSSMGLSSVLTIIFVIAKLMGVIHLSWWLVFAPTLVSLALLGVFLAFALGIGALLVYLGVKA